MVNMHVNWSEQNTKWEDQASIPTQKKGFHLRWTSVNKIKYNVNYREIVYRLRWKSMSWKWNNNVNLRKDEQVWQLRYLDEQTYRVRKNK